MVVSEVPPASVARRINLTGNRSTGSRSVRAKERMEWERENTSIQLYDPNDTSVIATMQNCEVRCMVAVPTSKGWSVWTGEKDGSVFVVQAGTKEVQHQMGRSPGVADFPWSMASDRSGQVWIGYSDGVIAIYGTDDFKLVARMNEHHSGVQCLHYHSGIMYSSGGGDHRIIKWDARTNVMLQKFSPLSSAVRAMAVGGGTLYAGSEDGAIRLFDVKTGNADEEWAGHSRGIHSMLRMGRRLWTGSEEGDIRIWDCEGSDRCIVRSRHQGPVVALLRVGSFVWSAGSDHRVCIWNASGNCVDERQEHSSYLYSLVSVTTRVQSEIWSSSADHTMRIWNTKSIMDEDDDDELFGDFGGTGGKSPLAIEDARLNESTDRQAMSTTASGNPTDLRDARQEVKRLEYQNNQLQQIFDVRTQEMEKDAEDLRMQLEDSKREATRWEEERTELQRKNFQLTQQLDHLRTTANEAFSNPRSTDKLQARLQAAEEEAASKGQKLRDLERSTRGIGDQLADIEEILARQAPRVCSALSIANDVYFGPSTPVPAALEGFLSNIINKATTYRTQSPSGHSEANKKLNRLEQDVEDRDFAITNLRAKLESTRGELEREREQGNKAAATPDSQTLAQLQVLGKMRKILECDAGSEVATLQKWRDGLQNSSTPQQELATARKKIEVVEAEYNELKDLNKHLLELNQRQRERALSDRNMMDEMVKEMAAFEHQDYTTSAKKAGSGALTAEHSFLLKSRQGLVRNLMGLVQQVTYCDDRLREEIEDRSSDSDTDTLGPISAEGIRNLGVKLNGVNANLRWLVSTFLTLAEKEDLGLDLNEFRPDERAVKMAGGILGPVPA